MVVVRERAMKTRSWWWLRRPSLAGSAHGLYVDAPHYADCFFRHLTTILDLPLLCCLTTNKSTFIVAWEEQIPPLGGTGTRTVHPPPNRDTSSRARPTSSTRRITTSCGSMFRPWQAWRNIPWKEVNLKTFAYGMGLRTLKVRFPRPTRSFRSGLRSSSPPDRKRVLRVAPL